MKEDILSGNDLCLPDDGDGHSAESENAERENETHIGFRGGNTEISNEPSHGKGSPIMSRQDSAQPTHFLKAIGRPN